MNSGAPPLFVYLVVLVIAAGVTWVATFPVRKVATRVGFVDEPDERRVHTRVTPKGGGAAMFAAFLVAMAVASLLPQFGGIFTERSTEPLGVVVAAALIFAVGMVDDVRSMSAPAKMAGQVLASVALTWFGVTMFWFKVPLAGFVVLSTDVTPLLTALWVIGITNAVNLIDGLDGLAAGVVAIASGALAVYGIRLVGEGTLPADNIGPLIAVVTCGICLGFLPHNFHPAKVFMGDAGAMLLGLLMAASTQVIGGRAANVTSGTTYFFFAPLFIPFFILGVPIFDMAFALVRRTARRTGFATPDKNHLHHRLLRLGHGHRRSVVILWLWTALLSAFVLLPLFDPGGNVLIPFGTVAFGALLYTFFHPGLRQRSAEGGEPGPEGGLAGEAIGTGVRP